MKTLKELGWSEDNIARIVGSTRPTLHKHLSGHKCLSEAQAKILEEMEKAQTPYSDFMRSAFNVYARSQFISKAYRALADSMELAPTPTSHNEATKGEQ